jgi:hypothetical protein
MHVAIWEGVGMSEKAVVEGRTVHFVLADGEHRPAVIVRVWPGEFPQDEVTEGINIQVFLDAGLPDGGNDRAASSGGAGSVTLQECIKGMAWRTSVRYSAAPAPGTWHWPEREG